MAVKQAMPWPASRQPPHGCTLTRYRHPLRQLMSPTLQASLIALWSLHLGHTG